jgi:hypothetical protein
MAELIVLPTSAPLSHAGAAVPVLLVLAVLSLLSLRSLLSLLSVVPVLSPVVLLVLAWAP